MRVVIGPSLPATAAGSTNHTKREFSLPYMVLRAAWSLRVRPAPRNPPLQVPLIADSECNEVLDNAKMTTVTHTLYNVTDLTRLPHIPIVKDYKKRLIFYLTSALVYS